MKPRTRRAFFVAQSFAIVAWLAACGEQGEGERCDLRNGKTADCAGGLVCSHNVLGVKSEDQNAGICCPPEGETTDVKACFANKFNFDGGTGGTGPVDAAADAADASADAARDASMDAARSDANVADSSVPDASTRSDGATADAPSDAP